MKIVFSLWVVTRYFGSCTFLSIRLRREKKIQRSLDELDVVWIHSNDGLTEWVNKLSFFGVQKKRGEIDQPRTLYISLSPSGYMFNLSIPHSAWYPKKEITPGGGPITEVFFKQHFTVSTISPINLFEHICLRWRDWHQRTFTFLFEIHSLSAISPRAFNRQPSTDMMILSASKIDPRHLNMRFCGSSLFIHLVLRAVCVFVGCFLCVS